jgi:hypothetical protein
MCRRLTLGAILLAALPATVRAELLTFTRTVVADYEFSLLGGTPLNPGPTTPFLPFRAVGELTFELDPSLNDPSMPATVPFVGATGILQGVPPSPAATLPHTISPNVAFLGGSLTNIVRDGDGEVISADVSDLSMEWELIGTSPGFPVRIYSRGGLPFSAVGVAIPFLAGTRLADATVFNGYLDDGDGDPTNDPVVVLGRNRVLTVVPEPSSAALIGMGALAAALASACRRARGRRGASRRG